MMSNTMPSRMKLASTTKASASPAPSSACSEAKDMAAERVTEMKNTCTAQRNRPGFLPRSSFFPFLSGFFLLLLSPMSKQALLTFSVCAEN